MKIEHIVDLLGHLEDSISLLLSLLLEHIEAFMLSCKSDLHPLFIELDIFPLLR